MTDLAAPDGIDQTDSRRFGGADRYEVCQTNGNIMVIGFRDQCGTTSRNYMSFDKMQRKLARGTENWDCKKK